LTARSKYELLVKGGDAAADFLGGGDTIVTFSLYCRKRVFSFALAA
jgi:hypothetical protein